MIYGVDERQQLERLHDRHKRLSLDVFDSVSTNLEKELIAEKKKELRETSLELESLMSKLHRVNS
ncbi:hypothetical protein EI546_03925 [Aequorivita sp. H23M31]|uniref:Uncharacterized protein n=1 Tax=Aequorivita ciconiae TaxID=2494375 RepID=A0A410G0X7_9FLAO|nr:hypothetical protein [Aequorivita sp. H23M31]QAA80928.1 hypothetical protein EI546_03925 [Aequorivita sp. H23M31]